MLSRTRPLAALLVAGALLLTGCSEEEPTPKIAAEPSASPTVVKEETAEEFIRRWNEASNEMLDGDSLEYRSLSPECQPCIATADKVDQYYRDGGRVTGEPRKIVSIERSPRFSDVKNMFSVEFESPPSSVVTEANGPEEQFAGGQFTNDLLIVKTSSGWQMSSYSKVSE